MSKGSDAGASPIDLAAEKAALEWLDTARTYLEEGMLGTPLSDPHRATLKALLAEPRLPAEPSDAIRGAMREAFDIEYLHGDFIGAIYSALYAELTAPPKPKISILRALCIAKTLKGEGELGDALRLLANAYVERHGEPA